ncbi:MAG: hypothetical protein RLZZ618_2510 [Pseudomonadota bacterium]
MQRLPVPVVVVGNLIAGGAGKTPTLIALVAMLRQHGHTPGVVSRGFGRSSKAVLLLQADTPVGEAGDEPLMIHLRTRAPVAVGRDRVAAAQALLSAHPEVDIVLSDDGLQHTRLGRDVQVIVFDERGVGNGWLLPAGPLREPFTLQPPARSLVLYNSSQPSTSWPGHVVQRGLGGVMPLADWWAGAGRAQSLSILAGKPLVAAAGVARPGRFFGMLREAGLDITELPLPDHHDYASLPWGADTADVVLTEKDAVKLKPGAVGRTRVWVATLDFALAPAFERGLMAWLPPAAEQPAD